MRGRGLHQVCQMLIRHSIDALVFIDPHPFDGFAAGHLPDHLITLTNDRLADLIASLNVEAVDRTVWIELRPCCGLDCPLGLVLGHLVFFLLFLV